MVDTFLTSSNSAARSRANIANELSELGVPDDDEYDEMFERRNDARPILSTEDDSDTLNAGSELSIKKPNDDAYLDLLKEAEEMSGDKRPAFCIKNKKIDTKIVRDIGADEDVEMTLLALGYTQDEINQALSALSQDKLLLKNPHVEEWIKSAIAWLS